MLNDLARIPTSSILRLGEDRAPRISFAQLRADGVTIGKEAEAILASIQNMNGVKLLLGLYAAGGSSDGLRRPVEQDPRDSSHWTHRKVMYQSSDGINVVLSMPKPVVDRLVLLLEGNSLAKPPQKR